MSLNFLEREMFQTNFVRKITTHTQSSITFFPRKSCRFRGNVEKYCRGGHATGGNIAHCMLDTYGYKHTLGICNAY
jgi:hypothetical protein